MSHIQKQSISLLILVVLISQVYANSIDFSYYHTTDEINEEIHRLSNSCEGYKMTLSNQNPDIYEIDLISTKTNSNPIKGFVIFGEHPREMISPETGVNFLRALCNDSEFGDYELASQIRSKYHLKIVLNSNPNARKLVEKGEYCRRQNLNLVDINRNWGSHWEFNDDTERQTSSGAAPFSEVETQVLKNIATNFQPNVFITIHSGTLGLYTPYAYSQNKAERNEEHMINIVTDINNKYCKNCGVGAAGKEVGYLCPGTCLDYIYENLNADYSFAFEIYSKNYDIRESLVQTNLYQIKSKNLRKLSHKHSKNSGPPSCFMQSKSKQFGFSNEGDDYNNCFTFFNPPDQQEYEFVVDNWTKAILDTLDQSSQNKNYK